MLAQQIDRAKRQRRVQEDVGCASIERPSQVRGHYSTIRATAGPRARAYAGCNLKARISLDSPDGLISAVTIWRNRFMTT